MRSSERCSACLRKHGAVRLGGIGGGEDDRLGRLAIPRAKLAKSLDGAAERELRSAEPFHEVAAARQSQRLERLELAVDGAVAAGDPFGAHAVARDDPLPLQ